MNKSAFTTALLFVAVPSLHAQDADTKPAPSNGTRYVIKAKSELTTERQMLIDGEERNFGGRGGRGGGGGEPTPVVTRAKIEFEEGNVEGGGLWRTYHTAEATIETEGRDGELVENVVTSALAGKKLFLKSGEDKIEVFEGSAEGEAVDAAMVRGLPAATNLAGLVPSQLEVGTETEIDAGFGNAIRSIIHPVRAENQRRGRARGGEAGGRGRRGGRGGEEGGRGGRGGEEGGRGGRRGRGGEEGGRGGRGGRGGEQGGRGGNQQGGGRARGGRRGRTTEDVSMNILASAKLDWTGNWTVESVEDVEGKKLATIKFNAVGKGKGKPEELGMVAGGFGRGRRGGGGADADSEGTATMKIKGSYVVDVAANSVHSLKLDGTIDANSNTVMVREMRGEEMEIEIDATTLGKFGIEIERK